MSHPLSSTLAHLHQLRNDSVGGTNKYFMDFRVEDGDEQYVLNHATTVLPVEGFEHAPGTPEHAEMLAGQPFSTFTNFNRSNTKGSVRSSILRQHSEPVHPDFVTGSALAKEQDVLNEITSDAVLETLEDMRKEARHEVMKLGMEYRCNEKDDIKTPEIVIEVPDVRNGLNIPADILQHYPDPIPGIAVIVPTLDIRYRQELGSQDIVRMEVPHSHFRLLVNMGQGLQPVVEEVVSDLFTSDIWKKLTGAGIQVAPSLQIVGK